MQPAARAAGHAKGWDRLFLDDCLDPLLPEIGPLPERVHANVWLRRRGRCRGSGTGHCRDVAAEEGDVARPRPRSRQPGVGRAVAEGCTNTMLSAQVGEGAVRFPEAPSWMEMFPILSVGIVAWMVALAVPVPAHGCACGVSKVSEKWCSVVTATGRGQDVDGLAGVAGIELDGAVARDSTTPDRRCRCPSSSAPSPVRWALESVRVNWAKSPRGRHVADG